MIQNISFSIGWNISYLHNKTAVWHYLYQCIPLHFIFFDRSMMYKEVALACGSKQAFCLFVFNLPAPVFHLDLMGCALKQLLVPLRTNYHFAQKARWLLESALYQWGSHCYYLKLRSYIGGKSWWKIWSKTADRDSADQMVSKDIFFQTSEVIGAIYLERPGIISAYSGKVWRWMFSSSSCKLLGF